jgi:hypothetical protein
MPAPDLLQALATIAVGAVSGGITNAVAIWMLFHPHEPVRILFFRFQGAIPKNKARLARSIGKTVGERLLTAEDLARRLGAPEVRAAFDAAVSRLVDDLVDRERGPLRDSLPEAHRAALEEGIGTVAHAAASGLARWTSGPDFPATAERWLDALRAEVGERPIGQALTPERRDRIRGVVSGWLEHLAEGDEVEAMLRRLVRERLGAFGRDEEPLIDRLPPGLVGAVEQGIADYLPLAIERLGAALADPAAKDQIHRSLRDAYDRAVRDLLLHERLVAKLVVTDATFRRLLDGFERDGFERFAATLSSPEMRERLARAINDAVVAFLRVPLAERLRRLSPEKREALERTFVDWLVRVVREPGTRAGLGKLVDRATGLVEDRTWGEVLALLPPERAAALAGRGLGSERGRQLVEDGVRSLATGLLGRPLGRPADWLGETAVARLRTGMQEVAWQWVQTQVPVVVGQIRVPEMVEEKVIGFSTQRMEEIVRGVTQRELDLIVRLGYVLGALVGLVAVGVNWVTGR